MAATVGFVGLGIMGVGMVKNLVTKLGVNLVVWNRGGSVANELKLKYPGQIRVASSPAEVVRSCQTTFCMLSTLEASEAVFDSPEGVVDGVSTGKTIVDCATLSPERMMDESLRITAKGGRFLEAPVSGSKVPAEKGELIFLCGGEESVFNDELVAQSLNAMGKAKFLFGTVGQGSRVKLVVNMVMGTMMSAFAEGLALGRAADLPLDALLQVIEMSAIAAPMYKMKGPNIINNVHNPNFPLKHAQKDMRLALELGQSLGVTMPTSAAANVLYESVLETRGDEDFSAVCNAIKISNPKKE